MSGNTPSQPASAEPLGAAPGWDATGRAAAQPHAIKRKIIVATTPPCLATCIQASRGQLAALTFPESMSDLLREDCRILRTEPASGCLGGSDLTGQLKISQEPSRSPRAVAVCTAGVPVRERQRASTALADVERSRTALVIRPNQEAPPPRATGRPSRVARRRLEPRDEVDLCGAASV